MDVFLRMFSSIRAMPHHVQARDVFKHQNTAERVWGQHADRLRLRFVEVVGWHVMLRNRAKYVDQRNSSHALANTARKRTFIERVFGTTNPSRVRCPDPSGARITYSAKPTAPKKKR